MKSTLKVMTIVGTRPELIRLSRIIALLDQHVHHILVHTGQNYDYELNGVFFRDLRIRKPDFFLAVNTSSVGHVYGETLIKTEEVLKNEKPHAVLILGDTNSCIAAIIAKRMKIPIYHMEAGNRCFDSNVPEEINRRIIDHVADFNLAYTESARRHLISEGLPHRRTYVTGSPMREVLDYYRPGIEASGILNELHLEPEKYFLVSMHREENVDNRENLTSLLSSLNALEERHGQPIIVTTHPRTRKRLDDLGSTRKSDLQRFLKPFGYFDFVKLEMNARCVLSDSGTICEESAMLSFPAITLRNAMERPEAIDAGSIIVTGVHKETILDAVELAMEEHALKVPTHVPENYSVRNTSWRVLKLILGTAKLSNEWAAIRGNDMVP